jgi:hypothetical protein
VARIPMRTLVIVLALAAAVLTGTAQQPPQLSAPGGDARLAFAHLAPFAADPGTTVTVAVDGEPVATNLAFGDSSVYGDTTPGTRLVEVLAASSTTPIASGTFSLMPDGAYTVVIIGGANGWDLELLLLVDDQIPPVSGLAKVRIGHLAPFAGTAAGTLADVRLQDGTVILNDVAYGTLGSYLPLVAGTYDLKITTADGSRTLTDPLPLALEAGEILSAFAVGDGTNEPVAVYLLPGGQPGYLVPEGSIAFLPAISRNTH